MTVFDARVPIRADGLADGDVQTFDQHVTALPVGPVDELLALVATAGLRGFGGADFPVARKWDTALRAGGRGYVVANGAESEPASSKDAALLQLRPHLVLDGLTAAARATNADRGVVWLKHGAWHSRAAVERALAERRSAGVVDVPISVAEGPARYLSGESSAVVNALSGGPALPLTRRVPAARSGIAGRPTVVHNVETLARVALLAAGVRPAGARLLTISTPTGRVVVEASPGDRLGVLAAGLGVVPTGAALLGGYGGRWHRWETVATTPLAQLDATISAGIVMTLPVDECGVATTARILRFLASSGARQCGPCIFGLGEISDVMDRVAAGRARRGDVTRLGQISSAVAGRGACHHPDGAISMLESAIAVFGGEFGAHRRTQRCGKSHAAAAPGSRAA
jgi:NADH:ubiquinone oxidoreductase subunit F (NADH-binding)